MTTTRSGNTYGGMQQQLVDKKTKGKKPVVVPTTVSNPSSSSASSSLLKDIETIFTSSNIKMPVDKLRTLFTPQGLTQYDRSGLNMSLQNLYGFSPALYNYKNQQKQANQIARNQKKSYDNQKNNPNSVMWKLRAQYGGAQWNGQKWVDKVAPVRVKKPRKQNKIDQLNSIFNQTISPQDAQKVLTPAMLLGNQIVQQMGLAPCGKISKNSLPLYIGRFIDNQGNIKTLPKPQKIYNPNNWDDTFNYLVLNGVFKWNQFVRAQQRVWSFMQKRKNWAQFVKIQNKQNDLKSRRTRQLKNIYKNIVTGANNYNLSQQQQLLVAKNAAQGKYQQATKTIQSKGQQLAQSIGAIQTGKQLGQAMRYVSQINVRRRPYRQDAKYKVRTSLNNGTFLDVNQVKQMKQLPMGKLPDNITDIFDVKAKGPRNVTLNVAAIKELYNKYSKEDNDTAITIQGQKKPSLFADPFK